MALNTPEIISIAALGLAILSALWQRFGVMIDLKREQAEMDKALRKEISDHKIKTNTDLSALKDTIMNHIASQVDTLYVQLDKLSVQFAGIDNRMSKQELKMDMFWGAVQDTVKSMIKQPVHFRKDELLDKFPNVIHSELCELKVMLMEEKTSLLPVSKELTTEQKIYLISLVLMLAAVDSRLIDMETKC